MILRLAKLLKTTMEAEEEWTMAHENVCCQQDSLTSLRDYFVLLMMLLVQIILQTLRPKWKSHDQCTHIIAVMSH